MGMSKNYNTEGFTPKDFGGYGILPYSGSIYLGVSYWDDYRGYEDDVTLDAVEVYKNLREYFKGTEYE